MHARVTRVCSTVVVVVVFLLRGGREREHGAAPRDWRQFARRRRRNKTKKEISLGLFAVSFPSTGAESQNILLFYFNSLRLFFKGYKELPPTPSRLSILSPYKMDYFLRGISRTRDVVVKKIPDRLGRRRKRKSFWVSWKEEEKFKPHI